MKMQITENKIIDVTPELLAKMFWEMDNDQQAEFFDALSKVSDGKLLEQMENVAFFTDSLSLKALEAMTAIGKCAAERAENP